MSSNSKKEDPRRGVKGAREPAEVDLADSQDSPWPIPAVAADPLAPFSSRRASNRRPANSRLPNFKDQACTVQLPAAQAPAAAAAFNRPPANVPLPDFKDQVRHATPPPQRSGKPKPTDAAPAFKQGEEEDHSPVVAPRNPMQQHQDPQAVLVGNGQDPSVTPFAEGIPINNTEALPTGGGGGGALVAAAGFGNATTPQTTVLRKNIVWAIAFVVLGTVVAVVVALTINNSSGSDSPTPPPPVAPPTLTPSVVAPPTDSEVPSEISKLTASDGAAGDRFGWKVAIEGDTIVVGAWFDDDNGADSGSAFVFTRTGTTWTEQAKLTASDGAANDQFGKSVAIEGDTIVVGAHQDDSFSGSAYVFQRTETTWTQQAKLIARDGAASDYFGTSVAIAGDTIVVGAHFDDGNGSNSGSAYVYMRTGTTWSQQAKLTASDAAANDVFGVSVAIAGDTIVVASDLDDDNGIDSGSVYVFTRTGTTWTQQAKLIANDGAASDFFGYNVAIAGDTIVVGARMHDDNGNNSGSAFVFTRTGTTWTQQAKLTASDGAASDLFGFSVAIAGDTIVVGAAYDDNENGSDSGSVYIDSGSAYVFTRTGTTWTEQAKLTANDAGEFDSFGISVAIDVDTIVVGSYLDNDNGIDSGSAYVYDL